MTKEQIKFFIDNEETIFDEIDQRLESLGREIELPDDISAENIRDVYDEYYKHCSDIFNKYNLNYDAFKTILSISEEDKSFREQILGKDEANQLIKDVVDIYGDEAYDILGCNSYRFEMSNIDGILSGENNQKYKEFYIKVLDKKCEQAFNLEELSDILLSTKPGYINQDLIEAFLKNPKKVISDSAIRDFIDTAPAKIINGNTIKALVNRIDHIMDISILRRISPELYDEKFSRSLLEKVDYSFSEVFSLIPEQVKNKDMWEFAISKYNGIVFSLPEQKIDKDMTDEEYSKWCDKLVIGVIKNHPDAIQSIFNDLKDYQKTTDVCIEGARLLQAEGYDVENFLKEIPETSRNRQIYEILLQKSESIIREIPNENFEKGLSQEEYATWVDNIITLKISQMKNIDRLAYNIPREKMTEKVWNALIDRCNEINGDKSMFGLSSVPIQNITIEMCKRALEDISHFQLSYVPSIDRKIDKISNDVEREEYKKWITRFSEKEKQSYRKWYEGKVIKLIETVDGGNIFTERFELDRDWKMCIPTEAITVNMINTYLQKVGPNGIENIPIPSELTSYNKQYEEIVLSAIDMLGEERYRFIIGDSDILSKIPEEYRTDKVILEAIKKHPKYLDYADIDKENFEELLQIGYKNKLESIGRTTLSKKEIELMKKFARNNSSLFSTLNLDILTPEIISSIGENNLERIVRYENVQGSIIELAKDKDALISFGFVLENIKQNNLFIAPLIEQLSATIRRDENHIYNPETKRYEVKPNDFLKLASSRIQDASNPLSEEEKTIISYLALNPQEANTIKNYDEILNFVSNKNAELDENINSQNVTLIDAKNTYLERIVGIDYESAIDLIKKYGNDPEQLLSKYEGKELETYKEKSEKESLEIIIKLKSLVEENDLGKIRQAYQEGIEKEDKTKSFERYKQSIILEGSLRRAYGRDMTQTLSENNKENNTESIEHTEDGQEYVVRKLNGPFNRMISVMNAYRKSEAEGDMYDRWNTSTMANNHALCYSLIDASNPGTALFKNAKGVIISISGFDAEAVTATAPYDLCSDSRTNTTVTYRQQRFYTAKNLPDQTRGMYSEVDIEIQDVSNGTTEYKKMQPTSIICFEKIDEDSIKASIELSKKLGRTIPIELIDRRELASQVRTEINSLFEQFKSGEKLQPELVQQIITKFNNVRNAHMNSSLTDELLGEKNENSEAMFNKSHLNEILSECIEVTKQRIEKGQVTEGLETVEQIKQFIKDEREKNVLMPTMYERQIMAGIDVDIDYRLDEIQRTYGKQEITSDARNESLEILQNNQELSSPTFEIMYEKVTSWPEQLSFSEFRDNIDISEIRSTVEEIHKKGYYSENKSYSEEHIARVAMFANAIANIEGIDGKTKKLLGETAKYYSAGRVLDIAEEHYQEYSAKIAGEELAGKYSQTDVGIVQVAIELQKLKYSSSKVNEQETERKNKIDELCNKYNLSLSEGKRIDAIETYISDAVNLDKARFVNKAKNPIGEQFDFYQLKTNTAKKLIESSYCMQDELSVEHLKDLGKVAHIDFKKEKDTIMKEFFTRVIAMNESRMYDESIIDSPIVQEEYFRHKYREIEDPVKLGRQLEETQTEAIFETPIYTEQQIGKATINVPTVSKDNARNREIQDEKEMRQTENIQSQLE